MLLSREKEQAADKGEGLDESPESGVGKKKLVQ
jgi:hypothetical protein